MKIILMRHGKPALENYRAVAARDMVDWIADYDPADIGTDAAPPAAIAAARDIGLAATSTAPRALTSLAALGKAQAIEDTTFREAALPVVSVPLLSLSPFTWVFVFRLLWLCGVAKDSESYAQAKQRSRQAADKLAALAGGPDSILLLGHGFMNRLIARQLLRQGWLEVSKTGSGYWGFAVYEKAE